MNANRTDWSRKLDYALWAYQAPYNTPTGISPCQLMYGKACHMSVELENKALRALNELRLEWSAATHLILGKMNEMDEFFLCAYKILAFLKEL